jgi:lipopolysaccharide export system protein LptA
LTTFYGKPGDAARLWQGSDSIAAPVLELSRAHATLSAHGSGDGAAVTAILTSQPGSQPNASPAVVRLRSRTLFYADNDHQATVNGAVVAQTSSGTLHANSMDIYFTRGAASQPAGKTPDQPGSKVEKIVARGAVRLQQPGRTGSGEQLTWTAADSRFVLTGTPGEPPRLSDQARGTVTGTSLIFNDRDDSVIVSGGASKAVTQTRVAR